MKSLSTMRACKVFFFTIMNWAVLLSGVSGNDFWTFGNGNGNGSAHSQTLGTGTGMINCIPNFWEQEREWQIHSQISEIWMRVENSIPNFWEWEREWKCHSQILGTGKRRCYSREWPGTGTGIASQNWVNIFCNPTLQLKGGEGVGGIVKAC